jgi:hypothetical protein
MLAPLLLHQNEVGCIMRFARIIAFIGCILLTPAVAFATAQLPEILIYEGKREMMFTCPQIPTDHPRIKVLTEEELIEKETDRFINPMIFSTACWRRYVGSWEIRDNRLFLRRIDGRFELTGEGPLFADWVSRSLTIPRGEVLERVHMGFDTVYEENVIIHVENGVVVNTEIIDNRQNINDD